MKRSQCIYILFIIIVSIFSFNMNVYAAQELTCIYEMGTNNVLIFDTHIDKVILVQDKDGNQVLYKNDQDVGISSTVSYWRVVTGNNFGFDRTKENGVKLESDNKTLIECPASKTTGWNVLEGYVTFYGTNYGNQQLKETINEVIVPSLSGGDTSENGIPELTCVYEKGDKAEKIAITQSSTGKIIMYTNSQDVSISDTSSYWSISSKIDLDNTDYKNDGYLKECPASKTTNTFYKDDSGEEKLVSSFDKVETISTSKTSSALDGLIYDSAANVNKLCYQIDDSEKWLFNHENYTLSCLYQADVENYGSPTSTSPGCHIIQINVGGSGVNVYSSESPFYVNTYWTFYSYNFDSKTITEDEVSNVNDGECPLQIKVKRDRDGSADLGDVTLDTKVSLSGTGETYTLVDADGYNLKTGAEASNDFEFHINFIEVSILNCDDLFKNNEELRTLLKTLVTIVKIAIPIILFGLACLDFAQAVLSSNEDGIKKAQGKFVKRLIIAVGIFLIPSALKLLLTIADTIWPDIFDPTLCNII